MRTKHRGRFIGKTSPPTVASTLRQTAGEGRRSRSVAHNLPDSPLPCRSELPPLLLILIIEEALQVRITSVRIELRGVLHKNPPLQNPVEPYVLLDHYEDG